MPKGKENYKATVNMFSKTVKKGLLPPINPFEYPLLTVSDFKWAVSFLNRHFFWGGVSRMVGRR